MPPKRLASTPVNSAMITRRKSALTQYEAPWAHVTHESPNLARLTPTAQLYGDSKKKKESQAGSALHAPSAGDVVLLSPQ